MMKKIISTGILICIIISLFASNTLAADFNPLFEETFENITESAAAYIASGAHGITTSTTNSGIKSYEFAAIDNSIALKFTGYGTDEITGNATRTFAFNFSEAYNLVKFPDTKLVVSFQEVIEKAESGAYTHTVINGTNGSASKALTQMFWAQNAGAGPSYRCNNNGSIGGKVNLNEVVTSTYVFDLSENTFDFYMNGSAFLGKTFISSGTFTDITGMTFQVEKNQTFSLDEVRVFTVPKASQIPAISGAAPNNVSDVSVESDFTAMISTYLSKKSFDAITITANGEPVASRKYKITQKSVKDTQTNACYVLLTIDFISGMDYGKIYNITFGSQVCDFLSNPIGVFQVYQFETEKAPRIVINSLQCKTNIFNKGNEAVRLSDVKNKYASFTMNTTAEIQNTTKAYCVMTMYNQNGEMIDCGFAQYQYEPNGSADFMHSMYIPESAAKLQAFVCLDLTSLALISETVTFE